MARAPFQVPETATTPRLAECLRAARGARGLTLKEASLRSGLSVSTLSKVENGQMSLTYDKLLQISQGLQMSIAELFEAPAPERRITARRSISQAGKGLLVQTPMYDYLYQFTDMKKKLMVPIMARLAARSMAEFGDLIRHAGEEYFLVLKGRVEVQTEFYAPELLEEGDGIYIDSTMGHAYLNAGEGDAFGVCVCSSPDTQEGGSVIDLLKKRLQLPVTGPVGPRPADGRPIDPLAAQPRQPSRPSL
jgi:transcriptional regulator with XRE-family HTH domain